MHNSYCPKCNTPWRKKETIYEFFLTKHNNEEKAREIAKYYGCTPETPKHFSKDIIGIETSEYDGVSQWECQKCMTLFDRFTMKEIERINNGYIKM